MAAQPPSAAPGGTELLRQGPLPGARENPRLQGEATVVVPAPADTRHGPPAAWGPRASGNRPGAQWGPGMKVTRCWPEPPNSVAAHRERQRARTAAHFQGDTAPRRDERVTLRQCGDAPLPATHAPCPAKSPVQSPTPSVAPFQTKQRRLETAGVAGRGVARSHSRPPPPGAPTSTVPAGTRGARSP